MYEEYLKECESWDINIDDELSDIMKGYLNEVPEEDTNHIYGSYKLSKQIITRIIEETRNSKSRNKKGDLFDTNKSLINDCELLLLLHLSHICNNKGIIEFLSYQDVLNNTDNAMCMRSFYNALRGLKDKGYIEYSKVSWGEYTVTIKNNDFSKKKKFNKGYINTNQEFFLPGTEAYNKFKKLSINAKKTFLYLILNYNQQRGFAFKNTTLSKRLNINSSNRVNVYIKELFTICGDKMFKIKHSHTDTIITLRSSKFFLVPNNSIKNNQWTYFKYSLYKFISLFKIDLCFKDSEQLHYLLNQVFNLFTTYNDVLDITYIKSVIFKNLIHFNSLDYGVIKNISKILTSAKSKKIKDMQLQG